MMDLATSLAIVKTDVGRVGEEPGVAARAYRAKASATSVMQRFATTMGVVELATCKAVTKSGFKDQRRFRRFEFFAMVKLGEATLALSLQVRNISLGGAFLAAEAQDLSKLT